MDKADCRIEWAGGAMERSTAELWQRIEKAIEEMSFVAKRDTDEQLETLKEHLPIVPESPKAPVTAEQTNPETQQQGVDHG